jgi:hypothetical protein
MDTDVYSSYPTSDTESASRAGTMTGERQIVDFVSDIGGTVSSGAGQIAGFLTERPLLIGSIAAGAVGAYLGNRLAQMIAMRRRKTAYDRAVEALGVLMAVAGSMRPSRLVGWRAVRLADARKNVTGTAQGIRQSVMEGLQPTGKSRVEPPSTVRQIGYGLSLIPVGLALIRNPLVRDVGFRLFARRIRPR